MLCVAGGAALVLRDVAVDARGQSEELADNVSKQLTLQLHRIDAALDRPERFPDWGAVTSSSLGAGQCVRFLPAGSDRQRSSCSGVDSRSLSAPAWFQRLFGVHFMPGTSAERLLNHRGVSHGILSTTIDQNVVAERALHVLGRMLGIWAAMIAAMCLLVYVVVDRALRPTTEILSGLNRLADGDLSCRLPAFRLRELDRIATVFNSLAQRLQSTTHERTELARKLVDAQEQERRKIARELHDDVAQRLNAMSCSAASIKNAVGQANPFALQESDQLMAMAAGTMRSLRDTLTYLRPPEIDDLGLVMSLQTLVGEHNRRAAGAAEYTMQVNGHFDAVPAETAAHIYRIVQEGLNNAARHASARSVKVTLSNEKPATAGCMAPRQIELVVLDDGVGAGEIDLENRSSGVGLLGMRERVHALNGEMTIGRGIGGGVELRIAFPQIDERQVAL
jgi:signal transduction histidine kinase